MSIVMEDEFIEMLVCVNSPEEVSKLFGSDVEVEVFIEDRGWVSVD